MWKIGNVDIKNRVVLAPMAGISNSAFQEIGCCLIVSTKCNKENKRGYIYE